MNDRRWERAMERLGLVIKTTRSCADGTYCDFKPPKRSDSTTFLRVVKVLRKAGCRIDIDTYHIFLTLPKQNTIRYEIESSLEGTFYEAIMEAFGKE